MSVYENGGKNKKQSISRPHMQIVFKRRKANGNRKTVKFKSTEESTNSVEVRLLKKFVKDFLSKILE